MRDVLLPVVSQENDLWLDFSDAIDKVFSTQVDNPMEVLTSLTNTYQWEPLVFNETNTNYNDEEPQLVSGFTYNTIYADFSDASLVKKVVLETPANPTQGNPESRPTFTDIPLAKGTSAGISAATYGNVSFNVSAQDSNTLGVTFNDTGTRMFVVGSGNDRVYQYTLGTAFDVSTATYNSVSLSVSSQSFLPIDIAFNNTGTRMFIVGNFSESVYQYSLSTAFDISTATYNSVSFSVAAQEGSPRGVAFNGTGTRMFIVGTDTDSVHQYTLGTEFDLSTATYDNVSFDVSAQAPVPQSVAFNNAGTRMFVLGDFSDSVYQYSLGTAFDISTATYDNESFDVSAQDGNSSSITFNDTGTRMFLLGSDTSSVHQYAVNINASINPLTYNVESGNRFSINFTLGSNESLRVISYRDSTYSINDYYDYGINQQREVFSISGVNLDIENSIPIGKSDPANLRTGYPYNLVILYGRDSSTNNEFQYITPANYFLEDDGSTITFLSVPGNYDEIEVTVRKPAVEISRKLNALGFTFENVEYVTRPTFVDNAHVLQSLSDNIGQYYIQSSGTPQFMDFFQYCSNSTFSIYQLWAQDNGNPEQYENFTREGLLPSGWDYIFNVGDGGGGWYPTSHVDVFYDIFLYGSQINLEGFREFFNYVAPVNLVLNKVIFGGDPGISQNSTLDIQHGMYTKTVHY